MQIILKDKQPFFYVLVRSWNSFEFFDKCINSILKQKYSNFKVIFVDDASNYTPMQIQHIKKKLQEHIVVINKKRMFSVYNGYKMIHKYALKKNSIVLILDADDWLIDNNALAYISQFYKKGVFFTYGECLIWDGKKLSKKSSRFIIPNSNTPYSSKIVEKKLFRREPFLVSHPMTFRTNLFKKIKMDDFKENNGAWLKYSLDLASYLPMLEMVRGRYEVIKKPLSAYNIGSPNVNIKINSYEFVREDLFIRRKKQYAPIV